MSSLIYAFVLCVFPFLKNLFSSSSTALRQISFLLSFLHQVLIDPIAPSSSTPSTSAPSSSTAGVTLEAIMAQFKHMDARLDSLTDEMCQVNTRVGRIA